jgi:glycosyltransferase involved in cell wall biosynthesis
VIIPAYNSAQWIEPTLEHLWRALQKTKWQSIEILVIDDGSKDNTAQVAEATNIGVKVKVIRQPNSGRLKTRKNGIQKAKGEYILLLDSRVYTKPNSFKYLVEQMKKLPEAVVWNGHVEVERQGNPFARFWYAVSFIAWRRYMKQPRLIHYGTDDFDYYPKGAGCFFAPREYLLAGYKNFRTYYKDDRHANDDTSLIRYIAQLSDIYISPGFAFTYNSRSTWRAFIRHTLHRGVVFIDGYFRPGTRYFYPLILYFFLVPLLIILCIFNPQLLLLILPALAALFLIVKILGVSYKDAAVVIYIGPIFAIYYSLGLYKGLFLKLISRKR